MNSNSVITTILDLENLARSLCSLKLRFDTIKRTYFLEKKDFLFFFTSDTKTTPSNQDELSDAESERGIFREDLSK